MYDIREKYIDHKHQTTLIIKYTVGHNQKRILKLFGRGCLLSPNIPLELPWLMRTTTLELYFVFSENLPVNSWSECLISY